MVWRIFRRKPRVAGPRSKEALAAVAQRPRNLRGFSHDGVRVTGVRVEGLQVEVQEFRVSGWKNLGIFDSMTLAYS